MICAREGGAAHLNTGTGSPTEMLQEIRWARAGPVQKSEPAISAPTKLVVFMVRALPLFTTQ